MPARRSKDAGGNPVLSAPPATSAAVDPVSFPLERGRLLHRIYAPLPYGARSLTFRTRGPYGRFDHHLRGADGKPQESPHRGIMYAGVGLACVLGEFFADSTEICTVGARVATVYATEQLNLLDLRNTAATAVGTTQAIAAISQRRTTQAWGRYLYDHPDLSDFHGLIFSASNTGHDAVALFERAQGQVERRTSLELGDPLIAAEVELAADLLNWPIARL